jgi:hypothetical protein
MEGDVAKLEVEKAKRDAALKALEEKKKSDEAMDKKLKEDETKVVSVEKLAQAEKASLEKKLKEETNLINELEKVGNGKGALLRDHFERVAADQLEHNVGPLIIDAKLVD